MRIIQSIDDLGDRKHQSVVVFNWPPSDGLNRTMAINAEECGISDWEFWGIPELKAFGWVEK